MRLTCASCACSDARRCRPPQPLAAGRARCGRRGQHWRWRARSPRGEQARRGGEAAEGKASSASERRAAEARVLAAEERASAAAAEVARLEKEVVERRRSKANLEKMYAAQRNATTHAR